MHRKQDGGMRHTPGPWICLPEEDDKDYIRIRGTQLGGRYKIANVHTPIYEGALEREVLETRANARLIAAAPDMLQALRRAALALEFAAESWPVMKDDYNAVCAAIDKVTEAA